ncbi:hypothetical protein GOP47_0003594 [Adiantum capillus-veneris]|uniref:Uncharacterized protein n=1 Tax=Adiantum capillus-veneris TaxID=13818 RepID=A0A9D4ZNY7_ADICA|nr:hypothetical protein GOP47_0003594 [Adiantum capillus-veneris]
MGAAVGSVGSTNGRKGGDEGTGGEAMSQTWQSCPRDLTHIVVACLFDELVVAYRCIGFLLSLGLLVGAYLMEFISRFMHDAVSTTLTIIFFQALGRMTIFYHTVLFHR